MHRFYATLVRGVSTITLAGAILLGSAAASEAGLILYMCNDEACVGGDDRQIADGDVGDIRPFFGEVFYRFPLSGPVPPTATLVVADSDPLPPTRFDVDERSGHLLTLNAFVGDLTPDTSIWLYATEDSYVWPLDMEYALGIKFWGSPLWGPASLWIGPGSGGVAPLPADLPLADKVGPPVVDPNSAVWLWMQPSPAPFYIAVGTRVTADSSGRTGAAIRASAIVPEPASVALLTLGILGVAVVRRRRSVLPAGSQSGTL